MSEARTGRVINIQRYSLHDGHGIRTLVFLKGCPLACLWCSNPESQRSRPELGVIAGRCQAPEACPAACVEQCPNEALSLTQDAAPSVDRDRCEGCGACAEVCSYEALKVVGQEMTVEEVLAEVERDRVFYRRSGGGLTVGGGEPLTQSHFTAALLEAAGQAYLHTALETCGHAPWERFELVLAHVDLLQLDLKHMHPQAHTDLTGQSNALILANLERVLTVKSPEEVIIRIPVVPGKTDAEDNIRASAAHLASLGYTQVELVPYHALGAAKYAQYGMVNPMADVATPGAEVMQRLRRIVTQHGLREVTE